MKIPIKFLFAVSSLLSFAYFAGCKSHPFAITVVNQTGAPVRLLEVDYPSASFGADSVDAGQTVRSGIHLTGSGAVKVIYTAPDKHQATISGPTLRQDQEGGLEIVLLPGDKADFQVR